MQSSGKGNLSNMGVDVDKLKPIVKQINSMYSNMSFDASRQQIQENVFQSPAKGVAKLFPKMIDFMTHLMRDKTALSSLLDMFKDKKRLTYFLIANVCTFILGFILAKFSSKSGNFLTRIFKWFLRKSFMIGLRVSILVYFFGSELGPTFTIFKNVFL